MNDVFNTTFEVSLRVLLTLEVADGKELSADIIAVSDFITVYGHEFGIAEENLHGENTYKFGEFALRRELVKEAVRNLVLDAFINAEDKESGFVYSISKRGKEYVAKFENDYARRYRAMSVRTQGYLAGFTERAAL